MGTVLQTEPRLQPPRLRTSWETPSSTESSSLTCPACRVHTHQAFPLLSPFGYLKSDAGLEHESTHTASRK